jgi:hypothetical protein
MPRLPGHRQNRPDHRFSMYHMRRNRHFDRVCGGDEMSIVDVLIIVGFALFMLYKDGLWRKQQ